MIRYAALCISLVLGAQACAAQQVQVEAGSPTGTPSAAPTSAPATGTPSSATATPSPSTVAEAFTRADSNSRSDGDGSAFALSLGTSLAYGNFGTNQGSRLLSTAFGVRYAIGTLRLSASIPYLNVRSRGLIFSGIDSTPIIAAGVKPGAPLVTHDGIGDLTIGAAYTFEQTGSLPEIELSGRVKLPTAKDATQLSTGKTDFSAGLQITKTYGRFAPFVSVTYRVFGDPASIDLENGFAASTGTSIGLGKRTVILLSYHYAAAASTLVRDSHELFAGISTGLPHSKLRLTGFATAGLSSGAAARSGGLSLALAF